MKRKSTSATPKKGAKKQCSSNGLTLGEILGQPALNYELDPSGDIVFELPNAPEGMPPDVKPEILGGLVKLEKPPEPTSSVQTKAGAPGENSADASAPSTREAPAGRLVRIRASSKHLILSCPYFAHWPALPFLLLMTVIHGKMLRIPRKVSLQMLADVALLVDFYECYGVVVIFSDMWISDLGQKLPQSYTKDAQLWLFISWVFGKKEIFNKITSVIQLESTEEITSPGLPVPGVTLETLNNRRNEALLGLINGLHALYLQLINEGEEQCKGSRHHCTTLMIGALIMHMVRMGVFHPFPEPPYAGFDLRRLRGEYEEKLHSPNHGDRCCPGVNYSGGSNSCGLSRRVYDLLRSQPTPSGLDIDSPEFAKMRTTKK